MFLLAAELLASPIAECLVIEDSATGISAADAAGAIPVFIPESNRVTIDINCYQFNNLAQFADELIQSA